MINREDDIAMLAAFSHDHPDLDPGPDDPALQVGWPGLPDGLARHAAQRLVEELIPAHAAHVSQVARIALALFDGLSPLHRIDDDTRGDLVCAALLHDVGISISDQAHHKHSRDLILKRFWVVPPERRQRIALIARYHRKALPARNHAGFDQLGRADRHRVWAACSCLRVADGLDRTHRSLARGISIRILPSSIELTVRFSAGGREELTVARRKSDAMAACFDRAVAIFARH